MPRLWSDTVASHRQEVREAILDAAGELVAGRGLLAVSMSHVAEVAGIGRATLYKYFADVEEVLAAWHARAVAAHLDELAALADGGGEPAARLRSVLEAYGRIRGQRARHAGDALTAGLHRATETQHREVKQPEDQLQELVTQLVTEAADAGAVRADVPAEILAMFCIAALAAAEDRSAPPVETLADLIWAALSPPLTPALNPPLNPPLNRNGAPPS